MITKNFMLSVVYFDQLLGAACTQKLVETFFSAIFLPFLFNSKPFQIFHNWNHKKMSEKKLWNEQKRLKNDWKKGFDQLLGARSTRKLVKIHNSWAFTWKCFFLVFFHSLLSKIQQGEGIFLVQFWTQECFHKYPLLLIILNCLLIPV